MKNQGALKNRVSKKANAYIYIGCGILLIHCLSLIGCGTSDWSQQREKLYGYHVKGFLSGNSYLSHTAKADEWEFYSLYRSLATPNRHFIDPPYPKIQEPLRDDLSRYRYYLQTDSFSGVVEPRER